MSRMQSTLVMMIMALVVLISSCDSTSSACSEGDNEESATQLTLTETYDQIRAGARLVIAYDAPSNSFLGTVENTTDETLQQVRVEVHLSNGIELGPTSPTDLTPGEKQDITLTATSQSFTTWSAHPEVGIQGSESGEEGSEESCEEHGSEEGGS